MKVLLSILNEPDDPETELITSPSECERSNCAGDYNNQISGKESNLFDVLKVLREATRRKGSSNNVVEQKYKRFSMNNFEDFKNTVSDLIDFSSKPSTNKVQETESNKSTELTLKRSPLTKSIIEPNFCYFN